MKVAILTAGCRLNQAESDALSAWLVSRGDRVVSDPAGADVCYVNTCTVTAAADRSSVQLVRRLGRLEPRPRIVVMGCLAQRRPERLRSLAGVGEVWSAAEKRRAVDGRVPDGTRSRALLKVQDGCDRQCAYCVVAGVRGRAESVEPGAVEAAVGELVGRGYREVVLTGLNLGSYLADGCRLAGLVARLLRRDGGFRLRLGSLEPDTVTDELLEVLSDGRVCPHFHLALQTADDGLLAAMGRPYRWADFRRLVGRLVAARPDACIGADVIAGLPGESEAAFASTIERLAETPLGYLHAFTFSARAGTPAREMPGQVASLEARRRTGRLRDRSLELARRYALRFLGSTRPAIVESDRQVLTDNYLRVRLGRRTAVGARQSCEVRIDSLTAGEGCLSDKPPGTPGGRRAMALPRAGHRVTRSLRLGGTILTDEEEK
jgi:threonylcarbamoyladenosine tRNA methylthiotransferase MtaB